MTQYENKNTVSKLRTQLFPERYFIYIYTQPKSRTLPFWARSQKCETRLAASSCLSVHVKQLGFHRTDFHEVWYLSIFCKSAKKIRVSLKSDKNNRYFTWRPTHFWSHVPQFFLEWESFQTKVVEKMKTRILCSVTFFLKSCRLRDNVEKYCRAGQATDDNTSR